MEQRSAEKPSKEWNDVQVDITRCVQVLVFLARSFPMQLCELFTDPEANLLSRPIMRDGRPVESREAVARHDEMIESWLR
ncbi:hypothetical protein [Bradyrhizobium sp. SZCCHNR1051]|uniref:hypothetical protein n=1 Tax=Bradyrhizobium sp. SZCCHNR1051 TaxID=3057355 RepID=UPI0029166422|nr:hypothetical protein [Bradyrhizobium sp. SZCCHNR1051]